MPAKPKIGAVFGIPYASGKFAYARLARYDDMGALMQLLDYSEQLSDVSRLSVAATRTWFYLNMTGIRKRWHIIGHLEHTIENLPVRFTGTPRSFWVLHTQGGDMRIDADSVSFDDMLHAGHVASTLWLPKSVEEFLRGERELKWKWI